MKRAGWPWFAQVSPEIAQLAIGPDAQHSDWAWLVHRVCALLDELRPRADGQSYGQQISFVTDRPGHDRRYAIDARKLERELGWKPAETFETGIRKTVAWYLDHPEWVQHVQSGAYRDWVQTQYHEEVAA